MDSTSEVVLMDPIDGWNYVFYVGNFLADAAIAAFAIKSGYIDKKITERENEEERLQKNMWFLNAMIDGENWISGEEEWPFDPSDDDLSDVLGIRMLRSKYGDTEAYNRLSTHLEGLYKKYNLVIKLNDAYDKHVLAILGVFILGLFSQIVSLLASGWINFFPMQVFILAFSPAIVILPSLWYLAHIERL